jgi:hypothetical protein
MVRVNTDLVKHLVAERESRILYRLSPLITPR